ETLFPELGECLENQGRFSLLGSAESHQSQMTPVLSLTRQTFSLVNHQRTNQHHDDILTA
ncbi:hypothetical protein, partial [Pseudomonas asiatica]|uniref:hypothetical protein n=1 Tax=Pseudomonas asiatica TaxID=2219225 RepID=UPI003B928C43